MYTVFSKSTNWQSYHWMAKFYLIAKITTKRMRCTKNMSPNSTLCLSRVSKLKYRFPSLLFAASVLSFFKSFLNKIVAIIATIPYCMIKIKIDVPISFNSTPCFWTTERAAKLNPMKEAWKYRIKKFQNTVFLIFKKN